MKITLTTSRVDIADGSVMHPDETHDVPDALASRLIETGQAVPAEPSRKPAGRRERAVSGNRETRGG